MRKYQGLLSLGLLLISTLSGISLAQSAYPIPDIPDEFEMRIKYYRFDIETLKISPLNRTQVLRISCIKNKLMKAEYSWERDVNGTE